MKGGRLKARHGLILLVCLVLAACAGVLGIEERTLDTSSTYPLEGYEGCRPGTTCEGCLEVHRTECDLRAACGDAQAVGPCGACVCEHCMEPLVDCKLDDGCAAISQCLQQTRCDLSETAASSCLRECQSVIDANGGLSGAAFTQAVGIRSCAVGGACLSCLPESAPAPGCRQENGCADCADCRRQCLCSGDTFSNCQAQCSDGAPPGPCSEQDQCQGCSSCFDVCACRGGEYTACTAECQGETSERCTAATSCSDCDGCVERCVCNGGAGSQCEEACQPPSTSDVCRQSNQGSANASCQGCESCLAACTCAGDNLDNCMDACDLPACCADIVGCESELSACVCGASAQQCVKEYACDPSGCDSCPCNNCHDTFALCQGTRGCEPIFDCMRATRCQGSACVERCAGTNGGDEESGAFGVAEALWSCTQGAGCACVEDPGSSASCGDARCNPYVGVGATLDACCPEVSPAAAEGGACGLVLQPYFSNARGCLPKGQQDPPRPLAEVCPSASIAGPPYNGATLQGCCRAADGTCGYWDDITGLGCLEAAIFGAAGQACISGSP